MQWTLKEVLSRAIQKEIQARLLYLNLSSRVKDLAASETLQDLAQVEQGHRERLESYLRGDIKGGGLKVGQVVDLKIVEEKGQPGASADMTVAEVLLMAAGWEKDANRFYLELAQVHPPGQVKTLLEELASQELEHKHRVEDLYQRLKAA
ncbi:MAG: ferritin family protein [Chloroflexota bacterium]